MSLARKLGVIAVAVAAASIGCGLAIASAAELPFTGVGNTIAGCYSSGGALKVRTPAEPTCAKGYLPLEWNAIGPQGPAGLKDRHVPKDRSGRPTPATFIASRTRTLFPRSRPNRNSSV